MYGDYLKERTNDEYIENERGLVTWRYVSEKEVYIIDIYVKPDFRNKHVATELADEVVAQARAKGCTVLIGTVVPSLKGADTSLKVLQKYGLKLHSAKENVIIMTKDI